MTISEDPLATPVQYVKGVGPYLSKILEKRGLCTVRDLLYYFPFRYVDRRRLDSLKNLQAGKDKSVVATVVGFAEKRLGARRRLLEMQVEDGTEVALVQWFHFNEKYLRQKLTEGKSILLTGECRLYRGQKCFTHPEIEEWDGDHHLPIVPVYSLSEGLHQKTIRKIIDLCLEKYLDYVEDDPVSVREDGATKIKLATAIKNIHHPPLESDVQALSDFKSPWHQRVVYDELFYFQLGLALRKAQLERQTAHAIALPSRLAEKALRFLPFRLTQAQQRVILELTEGMNHRVPANRLLQGDVGSGKTMVAFLAALHAIEAGLQVAFMAPTEILAVQHFNKFQELAVQLDLRVECLTGAMPKQKRELLLEDLRRGYIHLVMGTHALIQADVDYLKLGLVIIDEQHRFGVKQRAHLQTRVSAEGTKPHILVMTATPIPRTLAMSLYGDLDISYLDEMPLGRKTIKTQVYNEKQRTLAYELTKAELQKGHQAYFIYPLIEESEKVDLKNAEEMSLRLQEEFGQYGVGLLHGRMSSADKERIMGEFRAGKFSVLVSTTVVEVGVDVPNATVMVIEHAERFGLSQLHQLRGRVGRSVHQSYCLLLAGYARSEEGKFRLTAMEETNDGLKLAEEDLRLRGPGDFLGTRQHGLPEFRLANLVRDQKLLQKARQRAFEITEADRDLVAPKYQRIKKTMLSRWAEKLALGEVS